MTKKKTASGLDMLNGDWAVFDRRIARTGSTWYVSMKSMLRDMGYLPGDTVTIAVLKPGKEIVTRYEVVDKGIEEEE